MTEFTPTDWAARYAAADTPWDLGGPHPELSVRLQGSSLAPPKDGGRALVPGAGRCHDALALARRGWTVTAVDNVAALGEQCAPLMERAGGRFVVGDAFEVDLGGPFDLVWDHTFFCAIDPSMRAAWGARARDLVRPGGGLYGALVFPLGKPAGDGGPPHGMDAAALEVALGPAFRVLESGAVARTVKRRTWREGWFLAERGPLALAD